MADEKRRYKATIAGKSYTLIGPGTSEQFDAVTTLLNDELAQIKRLQPSISTEDAAILLAFNALSDGIRDRAQTDHAQIQD
ncbi:cell division protein ZapA [Lacticaseibacillus pabuli]|uniref:Cell division protein ZapA n=1 Tax=Lacticaseibacillus pabuli TaxID=3025672 RepID=A0ABY7WUF7_9LACO|nr:cell division protein ZapA [Lacticaseibacillus sp. KACC 23028]WDF83396.1 cell division protein ZapA [Lacticaseibacillus sp. KACC 23028]